MCRVLMQPFKSYGQASGSRRTASTRLYCYSATTDLMNGFVSVGLSLLCEDVKTLFAFSSPSSLFWLFPCIAMLCKLAAQIVGRGGEAIRAAGTRRAGGISLMRAR
jgi:hypothetical protein